MHYRDKIFALSAHACISTTRRISYACLILCLVTACQNAVTRPAKEPSSLSEFQWAVTTNAAIFFVERQNTLLPARASDTQVLESIPLRKRIQILESSETIIVPAHTLISPYEIKPQQWILQLNQPSGWTSAKYFYFSDRGFVTDIRPEPIGPGEFIYLRFISR